jgi:hypothetical protein
MACRERATEAKLQRRDRHVGACALEIFQTYGAPGRKPSRGCDAWKLEVNLTFNLWFPSLPASRERLGDSGRFPGLMPELPMLCDVSRSGNRVRIRNRVRDDGSEHHRRFLIQCMT